MGDGAGIRAERGGGAREVLRESGRLGLSCEDKGREGLRFMRPMSPSPYCPALSESVSLLAYCHRRLRLEPPLASIPAAAVRCLGLGRGPSRGSPPKAIHTRRQAQAEKKIPLSANLRRGGSAVLPFRRHPHGRDPPLARRPLLPRRAPRPHITRACSAGSLIRSLSHGILGRPPPWGPPPSPAQHRSLNSNGDPHT
eukprot:scaffold4555_cov255-Prasinococcus_capsulatus_cf.AAC.1